MVTKMATGRRYDDNEITPEMIEAGMAAVDKFDRADGLVSPDEEVCLIYRAMENARRSRTNLSPTNS